METDSENAGSSAQAVIDLVKEVYGGGVVENVGRDTVMVLPKGLRLERAGEMVESLQERPCRRRGTATLQTADSFIAWVNRNKVSTETCVYASATSIVAVINDDKSTDDGHEGGWRDFRAHYSLPTSPAWQAWQEASGHMMDQTEFAELIEERILDVLPVESAGQSALSIAEALGVGLASPSALMELSRGLAIRVNSKLKSATNLSTGEVQLQYSEEHVGEQGAPLKVPGAFVIGIPVFEGGAAYSMPVRLRYRRRGQGIVWSVQLQRHKESAEHAFSEVLKHIAEETKVPVFRGVAPQAR